MFFIYTLWVIYCYTLICCVFIFRTNLAWGCDDGKSLLIGDFNGDGRSDMLCHRQVEGYTRLSFANVDGSFEHGSW